MYLVCLQAVNLVSNRNTVVKNHKMTVTTVILLSTSLFQQPSLNVPPCPCLSVSHLTSQLCQIRNCYTQSYFAYILTKIDTYAFVSKNSPWSHWCPKATFQWLPCLNFHTLNNFSYPEWLLESTT